MARLQVSFLTAVVFLSVPLIARADVPATLSLQGVVAVHGERFTGQGAFRFALVDANTQTYLWVNDGSAVTHPAPPTNAVALPLVNGVYNVRLGDTSIANMTALPVNLFNANQNVVVRVWFDDLSGGGVYVLAPDVAITTSPYSQFATVATQLNVPGTDVAVVRVGPTGMVGIGSPAPVEALDIKRAGPTIVEIGSVDAQAGVRLKSDNDGPVLIHSPDGSNDLRLSVGGSDRVHVGADGEVGIGVLDPQSRLDVDGTIRSTGLDTSGTVTGSAFDGWDTTAADDVTTTTAFSGDVTGTFDSTVVGDDTHVHGDSTVTDALSINNGRLFAPSGGGNVGIGTNNPQTELDVDGAISGFGIVPIGTIMAWHKHYTRYTDNPADPAGPALPLPAGWVECIGGTVSDPESPLRGQVIPTLNNDSRFLRGGMVSGSKQADSTKMPNNSFGTAPGGGSHSHTLVFGAGGSSANFIEDGGNASFENENLGGGQHGHIIVGGDSETRPVNMSVVWIMRVK